VLANVSDDDASVDATVFSGFAPAVRNIPNEREVDASRGMVLPPHGFAWLRVVLAAG
jgi:amylosucrase